MSAWDRPSSVASSQAGTLDQGLRSYMLSVYNYMASGVLLTGIIAYFAGTSEQFLSLVLTQGANGVGIAPLGYIIMFAPIVLVMLLGFRARTMSTEGIQMAFWAYAALMGLSLFSIFLVYTQTSILRVFFVTAATFGLLSIYGYTTKKDLTSWRSFLIVGVWAVLLTTIVNMFLQSSPLQLMLSYVGVVLALGLTAYDTQKVKEIYYGNRGSADGLKRSSILGALTLYFDFIYLFINLLRIMGDRR